MFFISPQGAQEHFLHRCPLSGTSLNFPLADCCRTSFL
jgi:hypothetical protein